MSRFRAILTAVGMLALIFGAWDVQAAETPPHFLFEVGLPAGITPLSMPMAACFDQRFGELYVADAGNYRIVIFNRQGSYLFEFSDRERISSPKAIAVDSLGRILVLGEPADRIHVFDYDGTFLSEIPLRRPGSDSLITATGFAMDGTDQLYVLGTTPHIFVYGTDGEVRDDFPIFEELTDEEREAQILTGIQWLNDRLVVPMPLGPQLVAYSVTGERLLSFGITGSTEGGLSFPISVAPLPTGDYLVLDKHRHTLLQFGTDGRFIREFGGMGISRGWFYHPHALIADGTGQYFVLQTFMNRIQAVQIPGEKAPAVELRLSNADPQPASAKP